jgi:hypothetical protein
MRSSVRQSEAFPVFTQVIVLSAAVDPADCGQATEVTLTSAPVPAPPVVAKLDAVEYALPGVSSVAAVTAPVPSTAAT